MADQHEPRQVPASLPLQPLHPSQSLNGGPTVAHSSPASHPHQAVVPKPVFKMKRTGSSTLPHAIPIPPPATPHSPQPAKIISDLLPPSTPMMAPPSTRPGPNSSSTGARKTKFATDEERRRATSLALKERWRSGRMDIAVKKRLETIKRKKEEAALLGTPGITKPSGPVGSLKHTPKAPGSHSHLSSVSDLAATPSRHARKRSLSGAQLARLFDEPTPVSSTTPVSIITGAQRSAVRPGSAGQLVRDHDMLDAGSEKDHGSDLDEEEDQASMDTSNLGVEQHNDQKKDEEMGDDSATSIVLAAPGRPYTSWKDEDGSLKLAYGALIPEGYQLSTSTPQHPWICPIRACRKLFAEVRELGGHFIRVHRGARLHDNEDGTFSGRGQILLRHGGVAKQPAIVVSRGPADPSDPPAVAPSYPTSVLRRKTLDIPELPTSAPDADTGTSVSVTPSREQPDQNPPLDGDAEALWQYLQPHLVKHKGSDVPTLGWVRQLITLPKVRDLDWNLTWLADHPFNDSHPRDISALIVQVTGDPAPKPCNRCKDGKGPFRSCIMMSAKADDGPLEHFLSCANCFYHYGQTYCSHKHWGAERVNQILIARNRDIPIGNLPGETRLEENEGDGVVERGDSNPIGDEKNDSTGGTPMTPGSLPSEIKEAEPGRLYTMWPDENGQLAPMSGALIPAGYQLDTTIPGRPWVCPVRTCRKAHCKRNDLGFHFQRHHFAACLNDNGDGTFSIKSVYRTRSIGKGGKILIRAPPIVVSKEPLNSSSPIPKPELPYYLTVARPSGTAGGAGVQPREVTIPDSNGMADLWSHIQPYLSSTTSVPKSSAIQHLLALPKRRNVKFNTHRRRSDFVEGGTRDIAAILIQVTGDEVSTPCGRCRKGKGPFSGCVVVPETAHPKSKARYMCCANCLYGGKKLRCTLMEQIRERNMWADASPAPAEPLSRPRRTTTIQPPFPSAAPALLQPTSSALISQGTFQGQNELLEMEDWEIAPGRIRETRTPNPETIAFSKPYLSTPQPVPVCGDDVAFRVDTITPGSALRLEPDESATRLVSVAAGKVRVKLGEEDEFVVGPHGLVKVKAGVECVVRNGVYVDAVVHVVVFGGV